MWYFLRPSPLLSGAWSTGVCVCDWVLACIWRARQFTLIEQTSNPRGGYSGSQSKRPSARPSGVLLGNVSQARHHRPPRHQHPPVRLMKPNSCLRGGGRYSQTPPSTQTPTTAGLNISFHPPLVGCSKTSEPHQQPQNPGVALAGSTPHCPAHHRRRRCILLTPKKLNLSAQTLNS